MWSAIIEGISPPLVAGGIMVAVMGVMFVVHSLRGVKHQPQDPLQVLKLQIGRASCRERV